MTTTPRIDLNNQEVDNSFGRSFFPCNSSFVDSIRKFIGKPEAISSVQSTAAPHDEQN
jgi:hypothetical protein